jgi:hypothetical protein
MMLNTSTILDLLRERPSRYILHSMANYRMKEANGDDVIVTENGRQFWIEPAADQIGDLMDASHLTRDRSIYRLRAAHLS